MSVKLYGDSRASEALALAQADSLATVREQLAHRIRLRSIADSARSDSINTLTLRANRLTEQLAASNRAFAQTSAHLEELRANIDEDTLSLDLQNLLSEERHLTAVAVEEYATCQQIVETCSARVSVLQASVISRDSTITDLQGLNDRTAQILNDWKQRGSPGFFQRLRYALPFVAVAVIAGQGFSR